MRALLAVGCDEYQHISALDGAVRDAQSIFSVLVGDQEHQYDPSCSKLLVSPTAEQLRQALSDVLYSHAEISVFTLYFAGHATVFDETLYLALSDANSSRIPASAIGFPDVLRTTAGARPKQANFVIDACNAAGLGFDIASILKRTIVGNSDTMGISFIASAAAEQSALETSEGGRFTVEFVRVLRGDNFVQSARPFLSLAEIAQQVQASDAIGGQAISYWTLNLQGPNLFSKNPHFSGPAYVTDRIVSQLQRQTVNVGVHGSDFKSALGKITQGIDEQGLARTLEETFKNITLDQRAPLIHGLADGLSLELARADDRFLAARVNAILLGQLLGLCPTNTLAQTKTDLIGLYINAVRDALRQLGEAMQADRNALLVDTLSDLYELPIRISDILGQCALLFLGQEVPAHDDLVLIENITRRVLDRYGNSVIALTDDQATGYLLFLEMCRRTTWTEFSEEVLGRLFHDLHKNFARCGAYSLTAEQRFKLLTERYVYSPSTTKGIYSSPSDLTTVILSNCALNRLDDAVDATLIDIDHTALNYFVPASLNRFGLVDGLPGANYTITLGRDFWRCIDLRRLLISDILPKFRGPPLTTAWEDRFCSFAASLALRDRLPWHCIELTA